MDFRILRYFLNVAKEQSFTKAAERLHITQPTLSRQLAALEEELGVTLFARSGRNITLTEEGILLNFGGDMQKLSAEVSSCPDCTSYSHSGHDFGNDE